MRNILSKLLLLLLTLTLLTSCGPLGFSSAAGGYWVPPSANSTEPAVIPPTSAVVDPPPDPTQTANLTVALAAEPPTAVPTEPAVPPSPTSEPTDFVPPTMPVPTATPEVYTVNTAPILYYSQAADTLPVVAVRFGVDASEITSPEPVPATEFINPGQLLIIPRQLANTTASQKLIPDSEVVYSPSAINFDAEGFLNQAGGSLATLSEWHKSTGMNSAADVIIRVAAENSINPRLLLALLEYQNNLVYGHPADKNAEEYPMGIIIPREKGLYNQLVWAVNQLSIGYYAYREGRMTEIEFSNGSTIRLAPDLNAGTAALQYYFAQIYTGQEWLTALDLDSGFPALHARMFGDPWERAQTVEPLYPPGIVQPPLILPFVRNWTWAYTGGPHGAWERDGAYAGLDFAPGTSTTGCDMSGTWTLASASGLVVRTGPGLVVIDLDGDGYEQTGWVLIYLHIAAKDRLQVGEWVGVGDQIGHASCEGGFSTGTHIHMARKYNGEWVPADGPLPFNLGGWIAHAGPLAYKGTLTRDGETVTACVCSNAASFVTRTDDDP